MEVCVNTCNINIVPEALSMILWFCRRTTSRPWNKKKNRTAGVCHPLTWIASVQTPHAECGCACQQNTVSCAFASSRFLLLRDPSLLLPLSASAPRQTALTGPISASSRPDTQTDPADCRDTQWGKANLDEARGGENVGKQIIAAFSISSHLCQHFIEPSHQRFKQSWYFFLNGNM